MKFILTCDGELRSNNTKQKWEIRKQIAPQLEELWQVNPSLIDLSIIKFVPTRPGVPIWEQHHSVDYPQIPFEEPPDGWVDLCKPISVGNRSFLPLIRDSLALKCALKIQFLRKEQPGKVYQGGDLDNRLKTLFDALAVPNQDQIVDDERMQDPIHCLLEDDSLISGLSVETHRLLSRPNASCHDVRLVIEVDVRVARARIYNQAFLGD